MYNCHGSAPDTVHALMGENGAGKVDTDEMSYSEFTKWMKVKSILDGVKTEIVVNNPDDALHNMVLAMVHQELTAGS
ncbi:MAG: hypothetical protein ACLUAR_19325 [Pilosibacter sp.]